MRPTTALRALVKATGSWSHPALYDGISARLARDAGFAAIYATGGGIARSTWDCCRCWSSIDGMAPEGKQQTSDSR